VSNEEGDMEDGDPGADKHPHRNRDQRGSKFLHQVLKPKDKKRLRSKWAQPFVCLFSN